MLGPASWQAPLRRASTGASLGRHIIVFSRTISSLRRTPKDRDIRWKRVKDFVPNKYPDLKPLPDVTAAPDDLPFKVSQEVAYAVTKNVPVVALETTIYTHGFPYPENVVLALDLEKIVRDNGAIPATIGVVDGVARIGLTNEEITTLASGAGKPETMKVSRRDLPYILGMVRTLTTSRLENQRSRDSAGTCRSQTQWRYDGIRDHGPCCQSWNQSFWYWWAWWCASWRPRYDGRLRRPD